VAAVLAAATTGLLTGFSLIVAIGAQNLYVLRQGAARQWVGVVVLICAGSDLALITAGVGGVGGLLVRAGPALTVARWLGVAFLLWYAATSLRRALRSSAPPAATAGEQRAGGASQLTEAARPTGAAAPRWPVVAARTAAFTWLNPHVYLDTVLVIGTVGGQAGPTGRWWFAAGAGLASVLWFSCLGYGARLAAPALASPTAWRLLDLAIGLTMLAVAARLALG